MAPLDPAEMKARRLGRILTKMGRLTREQVHEALALQQTTHKGQRIGQILIAKGLISEHDLLVALSGQAGMAFVSLKDYEVTDELKESLQSATVQSYQVVPVKFDPASKSLVIAMKTPDNYRAVDDLRNLLGLKVSAVVAPEAEIDAWIKDHFSVSTEAGLTAVYAEAASSEQLAAMEGRGDSIDLASLEDAAGNNKVIQLLNLVLMQAIRDRASDIHFEPFEDEFKMRYRIDGILYEMVPPPRHLALPIVSRIKVLAKLDIAERRLPQDGRIELTLNQQPIDLRVAVLPTMFGESVVMRVLDRSNVQLSLDRIGLREEDLTVMRQLINKPNGIVVVTGPTGSGKTTTLYAALAELNQVDTKLLTAEDPVEYDIDGMCQCQVNVEQELTFARLLRSFLRQDPDIILVGEIRDLETAQIAIQASLTGHLVFTTVHTNDAPSTILRLVDLGVESFLLTATIEGIVAQRLVRRICTHCKEQFTPTEDQLMELDLKPADVGGRTFYRGRGCDKCNRSGYRGRMAVFEIMALDDDLRELISQGASTSVLRAEARRRGMRPLRDCGLLAIYEGQTTIDEVVRETIFEQ